MFSLCVKNVVLRFGDFRWDFEMPSIMEGSILIMAKAGSGVAMFSMGKLSNFRPSYGRRDLILNVIYRKNRIGYLFD